jgi:hypothetical protein
LVKHVGVDGCFIKLTTGQQILAATGRDGNNNIFPVVVDKEEYASWMWFLTQLKSCIGESSKFGNYTIISDRQKVKYSTLHSHVLYIFVPVFAQGQLHYMTSVVYFLYQGFLKAISKVFPNSPQRYCPRHIYANFQSAGFRGLELKKTIFAASYSYTKSGFEKAMDALKKECPQAHHWMMQIPVEAWARHAFDTTCKTELVVNNLSEVFNKMILDVRNKPIRIMLDGIKDKLMVKYSGTRMKAETTRWEITPFYAEKLEEAKKHSRQCKAKNADVGLW